MYLSVCWQGKLAVAVGKLAISKVPPTLLVMWFRLLPPLPLIAIPSILRMHRHGQNYKPRKRLLQRLLAQRS